MVVSLSRYQNVGERHRFRVKRHLSIEAASARASLRIFQPRSDSDSLLKDRHI
jgi:hypothetical protein